MAGRPNLGKKRIQVKLDPQVLAAADDVASELKMDRSGFIQRALIDHVVRYRKAELRRKAKPARPPRRP